MNAQLALQFQPLSRRSDPVTSRDAAEHSDTFRAKHESKIFGALVDAGDKGMTYREIAAATGLEPVAVGRRLKGMERRGVIERATLRDCDGFASGFEARDGMAIWWAA